MARYYNSSSSSSSDDEVVIARRPKHYQQRKNYYDHYDDTDFLDRFRLTRATFAFLLTEIEEDIRLPTNRGESIQPVIQLLLTLRFLASGCMLIAVGDFVGVSKSSASRIVKIVCESIPRMCNRYIKMAEGDALEETALEFYMLATFPRVIHAIDCTLIEIQSPGGEDAEIFRTRKGFFALNVQTISDAKLRIRNIVARWPVSVHDQTIFNNSLVKHQFENGIYGKYILV